MQLQLKPKKTAEITYLDGEKQKVLHNIFRLFEVRKKVRLMFWKPKDSMKAKCYVFSDYKQRNKLCFLYSECQLQ